MRSHSEIARELDTIAEAAPTVEHLMTIIVGRLQQHLPYYNWVGFYMVKKSALPGVAPVLVLGPYVGAETPHKHIPLDRGICGAAATSGNTIVVDDVSADPRYLACSPETRSEIVAPVYFKGKVIGELDVDSHNAAAFGHEDRQLVEHCAALVGQYLLRTAP